MIETKIVHILHDPFLVATGSHQVPALAGLWLLQQAQMNGAQLDEGCRQFSPEQFLQQAVNTDLH